MNVNESDLNNLESIAGLKADFNFDKRVNLFDLVINTNQNQL